MAQIRIRDAGGTLRTVSRIRMRDADNNLRTIQRVRVRDASGILRTVYEAMTAALSPTSLSQTASTSTITTAGTCMATPTGGTAPYTYLWSPEPYNGDGISAASPTSAASAFRKVGAAAGDAYIGWFTCTITDAVGAQATTDRVFVSITRSP